MNDSGIDIRTSSAGHCGAVDSVGEPWAGAAVPGGLPGERQPVRLRLVSGATFEEEIQ